MKKIVSLFFLLFVLNTFINAQVPSIKWQKCIGGTSNDRSSISKLITKDGRYIVAGTTYSSDGDIDLNRGEEDVFVGEMDTLGNWIWKKTYGGSSNEEAKSIISDNSGGYMLLGETTSNDGDVHGNHDTVALHDHDDIWIVKLDKEGNIIWQKCYGGTGIESAFRIIGTNDGGFAVIGSTDSKDGDITARVDSNNSYPDDIWVLKLDKDGNKQWDKCYGSSTDDDGYDIKEANDGTFNILGVIYGNDYNGTGNHGKGDAWFAKIDETGNLIWSKLIGGTKDDELYSFIRVEENNFFLVGFTESNDGNVLGNRSGYEDAWVVKLDSSANIKWQKCLGGSGDTDDDELFTDAIIDNNSNYIICGHTPSEDGDVSFYHGELDAWVVNVAKDGNLLWEKTFGGSKEDWGMAIENLSNKELLLYGFTNSNDQDVSGNHGGFDIWLAKLDLSSTLPLYLLSFSAQRNSKTNLLKWSSTNEINTDRFEIQRSSNGRDFTTIGSVKSYNNGKSKNDYMFTDAQPLKAVNYYRLKMIDKDGKYTYSAIRSINNTNSFDVTLYPNPVKNNLTLSFSSEKAMDVQIEIVSTEGKLVLSKKIQIAQGESKQPINTASLNAGNYFLKCSSVEGEVALRFVKQ